MLALREALLNAVVHRDYANSSDIQIKIFDDRITIFSPGKLYGGFTIEEIKTDFYQSHIRNKLIAEAFYLTKNWVERIFIVNLQPKAMRSETEEESNWLNRDGTNFASWFRYLSQEYQDKIFQLTQQLRDTIPGFHAFRLEQAGRHRILKVGFCNENEKIAPIYFDFERLSDGQRVIIVLYSLLLGLRDLRYTVFLDEPENYVALPEIQPWLMELSDICGDGFSQAILISHHPELIDYLGPECGKWIERDALGPVRVKNMPAKIDKGFKLSEQIARGWSE